MQIEPQKQKHNIWLIAGVSAATVSIVLISAFIFGFIVKPFSDQPARPLTSQVEKKIKGNKNSRIYHLPHCPNYNDIKESNIVWFATEDEAQNVGYRKAKNC